MYSSYYFLESGVSVEDKYEKSVWTIETISEMVNDWIAFEFILELKRRMKNVEAKYCYYYYMKYVLFGRV